MEYEELTSEQKEKVKAIKTAQELADFARDEGIELTDEQLDAVAGGAPGWNNCHTDN